MKKLSCLLMSALSLCMLTACGETVHTYHYPQGKAILGKIDDTLQCYKLTLGTLDGTTTATLPAIQVIFPGGEKHDISTIPLSVLEKHGIKTDKLPDYTLKIPTDAEVYEVGEADFVVRDGKTIYTSIWRRWTFKVREGETLDSPAKLKFQGGTLTSPAIFPMEKEHLIKLLGKPSKKKKETHLPG